MAIKRYELDLGRGIFKADGAEDHQRMLEAVEMLGVKKSWSPANVKPLAVETPTSPPQTMEVGRATGPRYMKLFEEFKRLKRGISPATLVDYEKTVREFEELHGVISITEVTDEKMSEYMRHLAEHNKNSETTIDKKVGALRALFNFGVKQKMCSGENPANGRNLLTKAQKQARGHKFYELDELKEIFARPEFHALKTTKPNFRLLAAAAVITGVRISALAALRSDDFRTSVNGKPYLAIDKDKTGAGRRSVTVPKRLHEEMKNYLIKHETFGYKARNDGKGASDPVRKDLNDYLKSINITAEGFTIHGLRKTLNDYLVRQKVGMEARCQFMGHALSDVNLGIYTKGAAGAKLTIDEVAEAVLPAQEALLDLIEF